MSDDHSINLADDNFVRSVINRQVGKLIAKSDFTHQDRSDLVQEVYVRATKSLQLYDPSVGHLYPYVCTVVQRHLANVVRDRSVVKRATVGRVSLSKTVRSDDGGQIEMSQTLHDKDQDRRLGRARRPNAANCYADGSNLGAVNCQTASIYANSDDQAASRTASRAIGKGMSTTNATYSRLTSAGGAATSTYAAGIAHAYSNNGKTDWHLPSQDEINELYTNRVTAMNDRLAGYWSSTEWDGHNGREKNFGSDDMADGLGNFFKSTSKAVRAVRAF